MLNHIQIIGHLGKDPETRTFPNGDAVCNFSVATTEKWKDKQTGEAKEATEWHRISTFGKLAEICGQYLRKGSLVYVSGKLVTRKWTDKDGIDKFSTEVKADQMKMLGGRPEGGERTPERADATKAAPRERSREAYGTEKPDSSFDDMGDAPF